MNFSNIYTIYPFNRSLAQAMDHYVTRIPEEVATTALADSSVTVNDNFTHTRGNFEQKRYSANAYANAVEIFEAAITDELRKAEPLDWVRLQNHLGNVLAAMGQQQMDEGLYNRAIAAFNSALEELSQEETPVEWATTQYNLGTASQALGRLQGESKLLKAAVDAYTNALLVWSRDEATEDWMFTMHQLGATFHAYGKLLKGNRTFQKSVVAYKNALAALNADEYALELTATHNNRGAVLQHLGESEENPGRIEEAINSYQKALTVSLEQQLPVHIAVLCRVNKVTAQNVLAELTNDAVLAEEVADEYEVILECFPHALQPLCVKHCEEQRAKAQSLTAQS
jgi:tetratricopeptide (TPR) repeat protein